MAEQLRRLNVGDVMLLIKPDGCRVTAMILRAYNKDGVRCYDGQSTTDNPTNWRLWWRWTDGMKVKDKDNDWRPHPDADNIWAEYVVRQLKGERS